MSKSKISKQVFILGFVSLFTDIASEMLYPVTPIFLTSVLGASMMVVGLVEGIAEVTAAFLKGYFGRLSDKTGKRALFVVLGYSLSAIVKPLPGIFPRVSSVVVSRTLDRVGKGIRTAPRDALLGSYSKGKTGTVFGLHRAMDTFGAALGPVAALILLYFYPGNYQLIFLAAFVPSLFAIVISLMVKDKPTEGKTRSSLSYFQFIKQAPAEFKRLLILIVIFSFVNSSDVFLILKSENLSGSGSIAILSYVFFNIVYAVFSYPLGKLSDKYSKKMIFIFGLIVFSIVYFGFAFAGSQLILWFLFAFYGIYSASTEGISKAWVSDLIPDELRGSAIGLLTMLSGFSIMLGSVAAGILWDFYGSTIPFLISAIASLLVAGAITIFIKK